MSISSFKGMSTGSLSVPKKLLDLNEIGALTSEIMADNNITYISGCTISNATMLAYNRAEVNLLRTVCSICAEKMLVSASA